MLAWRRDFHDVYRAVVTEAGVAGSVAGTDHVFYPCGGGDVFTALAVHPEADGFIIAARDPVFGQQGRWDQRAVWSQNASFVASVREQAAAIVELSHSGGYQYGESPTGTPPAG